MRGAVHLLILKTLDRVTNGGLGLTREFASALQEIARAAQVVYQKYPVKLRPEFEKELKAEASGHLNSGEQSDST